MSELRKAISDLDDLIRAQAGGVAPSGHDAARVLDALAWSARGAVAEVDRLTATVEALEAERAKLRAVVLAVAHHLEDECDGRSTDLDDNLMESLAMSPSDSGYFVPAALRALAGGAS